MPHKEKLILFVILAFSLVFRLTIVLNSSFTFHSDDAIYAELAQFWLNGQWNVAFHPYWQPLFPALSALFYFPVHDWGVAERLVSIISGVFLAIPAFFLAQKSMSKVHGLLFATSLTFFTPILDASLEPLSDMLATFLTVSALVTVFFALQNMRIRIFGLAGGLMGLSYLARPEATMLFGLTLTYLVLYFGSRVIIKKIKVGHATKSISLFFITFVIAASPYLLSNRLQLGYWSLSPKFSAQIQQGHAFALRNGTTWAQEIWSAKSPNYQSEYFENSTPYLLRNITWFVESFYKKIDGWQKICLTIFPPWSLPLVLIGVLSIFKNRLRWSLGYFVFVLLFAIPTTIFTTVLADLRYLLWTFPFFLLFFYLGTTQLALLMLQLFRYILGVASHPKFSQFTISLPLLASLFFPSFPTEKLINPYSHAKKWTQEHTRVEINLASLWIKEHAQKTPPRIAMRHEGIEFYTTGEIVYLPQTSYEDMLNYTKSKNVDYIIAWDQELAADRALSILLTPKNHPGLQKVYQYPQNNPRIIVYKLEN